MPISQREKEFNDQYPLSANKKVHYRKNYNEKNIHITREFKPTGVEYHATEEFYLQGGRNDVGKVHASKWTHQNEIDFGNKGITIRFHNEKYLVVAQPNYFTQHSEFNNVADEAIYQIERFEKYHNYMKKGRERRERREREEREEIERQIEERRKCHSTSSRKRKRDEYEYESKKYQSMSLRIKERKDRKRRRISRKH